MSKKHVWKNPLNRQINYLKNERNVGNICFHIMLLMLGIAFLVNSGGSTTAFTFRNYYFAIHGYNNTIDTGGNIGIFFNNDTGKGLMTYTNTFMDQDGKIIEIVFALPASVNVTNLTIFNASRSILADSITEGSPGLRMTSSNQSEMKIYHYNIYGIATWMDVKIEFEGVISPYGKFVVRNIFREAHYNITKIVPSSTITIGSNDTYCDRMCFISHSQSTKFDYSEKEGSVYMLTSNDDPKNIGIDASLYTVHKSEQFRNDVFLSLGFVFLAVLAERIFSAFATREEKVNVPHARRPSPSRKRA